ncbi:hypothetical protein AMAG_19852 [Allomyces macrogynus ATCC 38327]|uniref:Uncharacterized protein n=1 Tax=Allomyces macrogynus (strain ATCC 38327) TaxID=578462 RepID=A0A0L0T0I6_ALLM3|nr:hypothetical protein AMAG_19852 [Allomyces macrogynus ATCC 38327]|eukprot:KNE68160.1 hypothetical protein AMAG_19852 [Allomyces macrogynus ATCC 38327]
MISRLYRRPRLRLASLQPLQNPQSSPQSWFLRLLRSNRPASLSDLAIVETDRVAPIWRPRSLGRPSSPPAVAQVIWWCSRRVLNRQPPALAACARPRPRPHGQPRLDRTTGTKWWRTARPLARSFGQRARTSALDKGGGGGGSAWSRGRR